MAEEVKLNRQGDKRGMHPNSLKNMRTGHMGNNYSGKDYSITRIIKGMIDEPAEERWLDAQDKGKGLTWRQAIAVRMLRDGVTGKYCELLERLEGKVTQPVSALVKTDVTFKIGRGYANGEPAV